MTFNQFAKTQVGFRYKKSTDKVRPVKPRMEPGREYTGLYLVKWFLDNGQNAEAIALHRKIKMEKQMSVEA